jgi:hypothetical protein
MNLLTQNHLQPPRHDETVFRLSLWGPLLTFLLFLLGVLFGVTIFFTCFQSSIIWGMILSGLYTLIMLGLCRVLFHAVRAAFSPSNWLARIGPHGVLLKFRSYLHDDSPEEDPIALQLSWPEILDAQLQQEIHTTTDSDGKSRIARWFLALTLNPRYVDIDRIKSALEFESQRKPAHFSVDDLKHELFLARKNRAGAAEIARIKQEIAQEKKRHPGKHSKVRFNDRPIVFVKPDQLRIEWTHITPGKKKLRQQLLCRTKVISDQEQDIEIEKPMTESEFITLLETLLARDEKIEALKLVRQHLGLSTTEAKAYLENIAATSLRHS